MAKIQYKNGSGNGFYSEQNVENYEDYLDTEYEDLEEQEQENEELELELEFEPEQYYEKEELQGYFGDDEVTTEHELGTLELVNYLPRIPLAVYYSQRDFTAEEWKEACEDFQRGHRPLEAYREKYFGNVLEESLLESLKTIKGLATNAFKVSPSQFTKWLKRTTEGEVLCVDPNLIKSGEVFKPFSVFFYRNMMRYTCQKRFSKPWDEINWHDTTKLSKHPDNEDNPESVLSSHYWKAVEAQYEQYQDLQAWFIEQKNNRALVKTTEVVIGEYVETNQMQSDLRLAEAALIQAKQSLLTQLAEESQRIIQEAAEMGAKTRKSAAEVFASQVQSQPQIEEVNPQIEEQDAEEAEDDLWNES